MIDRDERIKALEEVVRLLGSVKIDSARISELDFDHARVDAYLTTALSAARSALALAKKLDDEDAP